MTAKNGINFLECSRTTHNKLCEVTDRNNKLLAEA